MLIGIFYSQIVEISSFVSVLFREAISHPYISFFHLLVTVFSVTGFRTFSPLTFIILVGGIGGQGGIKIASAKNNQLIGRAKRAPHWGVQSRFRVIYVVGMSYVCRMSN